MECQQGDGYELDVSWSISNLVQTLADMGQMFEGATSYEDFSKG
jgi:hypothetical protein